MSIIQVVCCDAEHCLGSHRIDADGIIHSAGWVVVQLFTNQGLATTRHFCSGRHMLDTLGGTNVEFCEPCAGTGRIASALDGSPCACARCKGTGVRE